MARLPFDGRMRITSAYGMRTDPITGQRTRHGGLDIVGEDYLIRAVCDGVVAVSQMVEDKTNATWPEGERGTQRKRKSRLLLFVLCTTALVAIHILY